MPLPEPPAAPPATPAVTPPGCHIDLATWAWLALMLLSGVSVLAAGQAHHGHRLWMTVVVAAIAWGKAQLVIRHYLEARHARPVFHRIVQIFAALAPLALVISALREL